MDATAAGATRSESTVIVFNDLNGHPADTNVRFV